MLCDESFITTKTVETPALVKGFMPKVISLSGMATEVRLEQPKNAPLSMEVTEPGMVTEVKLEQPENARLPMEVTEPGMVTEVRLEQPGNAPVLMEVTVSLMV